MRISECVGQYVLPYTVNATLPEERDRLNMLGQEIAGREGFHYEGYCINTIEPFNLDHAKAILYFD